MPPAADDVCEVIITAPDPDWLVEFSRRLVIDRLCASGHNFQPIRTIYRWHGHVHDKTEGRVALRTRLTLLPQIVDRAKREHPYEVPSVVAVPIIDGGPDYLSWILDETAPSADTPSSPSSGVGQGSADDRIKTARLVLVPVTGQDADELASIFADERLYAFTGEQPATVEQLRAILARLAEARAADAAAQLNWVVRRLADQKAVGMLQAVFSNGIRAAEIAWLVGVPWQGQGIASEAATAVVAWLETHGVEFITAWIRPDHHASESVAARAGLTATGETRTTDKHEHPEQLWKRRRGRDSSR
jgi:periplasmic divalent cation tolerance protein